MNGLVLMTIMFELCNLLRLIDANQNAIVVRNYCSPVRRDVCVLQSDDTGCMENE